MTTAKAMPKSALRRIPSSLILDEPAVHLRGKLVGEAAYFPTSLIPLVGHPSQSLLSKLFLRLSSVFRSGVKIRIFLMINAYFILIAFHAGWAQDVPQSLTLKQAEAIAAANHPQVKAGALRAEAGQAEVEEARSALYPIVTGDLTGVDAESGSRISAGGLNNPLIYSRYSNGLSLNQRVTDFGRTPDLIKSSLYHEKSLLSGAEFTRLSILLQTDFAYYNTLRAEALLKVAQETAAERRTVLDQISVLVKNKLKSGLDLSFAQVALGQAELFLTQAQNGVEAGYMTLSAALGYSMPERFILMDEVRAPELPEPLPGLISAAFQNREDLNALRMQRTAAGWYAKAEGAQSNPTVDLAGALGESPFHEAGLTSNYAVIGLNVSVPIFNGNLFSQEEKEARLNAQVEDERVRDLKDQIAHDVGTAQLDVTTAYQNLALTADLRKQAAEALDLAQARYNLGLSSIVELSQAQLNLTQAEIDEANARYNDQLKSLNLDFQTGVKR